MCQQCDYVGLLESHGLNGIPNRVRVLEVIGNSTSPLSAQEIYETVSRTQDINRVTVYRILDLMVDRKLIDRLSTNDRAFHYGLAPNANHPPHPHFYCRHCGIILCLNPESLDVKMESLLRTFPGVIERADVRLDGTCKNCLKRQKKAEKTGERRAEIRI